MSDKEKILNDEQMEEVSGGHHHHHDHEREKYEGQHGWITKDAAGNVTFTDKTGNVGTFSASDWQKLCGQWAYTGNPEFYISTIDNSELRVVLAGL